MELHAGPREWIYRAGDDVYFEVYGKGDAVVLSHGYGGCHASWYQQVMAFAPRYRVVTWDQRGFGRSTNRHQHAGPATAAADLGALLDQLEIERAHLVGQSMGGWAVMGLALEHPERVASLVFSGSIAGIYTPSIARSYDEVRRARAAGPPLGHHPPGHHPALGRQLARRDLAQAFLYEQIASVAPPPPGEVLDLLRATAYPHERLRRLEIPALFIVGEEDSIFPPESIREAATLLPLSRVVEVAGAGHSPYFETPRRFNETVAEFWGWLLEPKLN